MDMKHRDMKIVYKLYRVPAAFLAAGWPFIVHAAKVPTHLDHYPWYPNVAETVDFFLVHKSRALCIVSLVMFLLLAVNIIYMAQDASVRRLFPEFGKKGKIKVVYAGVGIFIIGAVVSSLRSPFPGAVWHGMVEQYENLPVVVSYFIIFLFTAVCFRTKEDCDFVRRAMLAGTAAQCLVGISQLCGYDFFSTIARQLIGAGTSDSVMTEFVFAKDAGDRVYMCFYHPNYAAVYLMVMLPICLYSLKACISSLSGGRSEKSGKQYLWVACYAVLLAAMILCLAGTGSKTSIIVIIICAVAAVVSLFFRQIYRRSNRHKDPAGGDGRRIGIMASVVVLILTGSIMFTWNLWKESGRNPVLQILGEKTQQNLLNVSPEAEGVSVDWKGQKLLLTMQKEGNQAWFSVLDEGGNAMPLDYEEDTQRFIIRNPMYSGLSFDAWTDHGTLCITMYQQVLHGESREEIPWYFRLQKEQGEWQYVNLYQKPDKPVNAEHTATFGFDNGLSGRVYIWSRTVPLMKDRILLGSGADSFALSFPQNDYAARANVGLDLLMPVISRAHSLYLQCAVQFGLIPSVCLFAALLALIFGKSRHTTKPFREQDDNRYLAEMNNFFKISMLLWLLMGITNDSVIVVTPFVCLIAGLVASMELQTISAS